MQVTKDELVGMVQHVMSNTVVRDQDLAPLPLEVAAANIERGLLKAIDVLADAGTERVMCEKHGMTPHSQQSDCVWPHLIGPSGPYPSVGHPLTVHD